MHLSKLQSELAWSSASASALLMAGSKMTPQELTALIGGGFVIAYCSGFGLGTLVKIVWNAFTLATS